MSKTAITGSLLSIELDRESEEPLYRQLMVQLRTAIDSGRLAAGTKLPSTRVFADEFGVSRNTALQVFEQLVEEGVLTGRVGAGTFVADVERLPLPDGSKRAGEGTAPSHGYPFRSLSQRGRSVVASATGEFSERPTSFMPDMPDLREFPIKTWLRLLAETSGRLTGGILADTTNAGYEPLRRALAQHLNSSRGMKCDYTQVIITTGSQQSLDLICRMLLDPGDPVWLEEPGYVGARAVMKANGAAICPVPVDEDGLCVEIATATHPVPRLVFVSPSRQYPLGSTLSMARRKALVDMARKSGSWIVEDDYDNEFRYAGTSLPAIHGLDSSQRTIHVGTFSKILLPSFRLGYLVVPPDLSEAFAAARAIVDRHASLIEQMVLSEFMLRGLFASHVRRMRVLYRSRQHELVDGLCRLLGKPLDVSHADTGTHLALLLRSGVDDRQIAHRLALEGVIVRPLTPYYVTRQRSPGLLLGFSAFNTREIDEGLKRMEPLADELRLCLA